MSIENIKMRGSHEVIADTRTKEYNAQSKKELALKILASMGVKKERAPEDLEAIRNEVVAAYNDKTSGKFKALGAAIANQLSDVAARQGFARKLLKKVETVQGADIRVDVKYPNSVATVAISPSQVETRILRDKHIYPVPVDIAENIMIHKQEIDRTTGDILSEKLLEGQQAIQVAEDRLWKAAADSMVGIRNPQQLLTGGLTPTSLGLMYNEIVNNGIPASTFVAASDVISDFFGPAFSNWFDPVSQYEIVSTGMVGSLLGLSIITDAFREQTLKVLNAGEVYVISSPEYHGGFADRGPVESTELDGAYQGTNTRGWFMAETVALVVHNPRSVVKGKRA